MSQVLRKDKQRLVFAKYRVVADTAFKQYQVLAHILKFHTTDALSM